MPDAAVPAATLEAIAAKVDLCIVRTELSAKHSERAADAAERVEEHVAAIRQVAQRQASDMVSLRHGIPASWPGRLAIVGFSAIMGAMAAISVAACAH